MTPFTVDWLPDALDMLADIWTQASDRSAVTAAQNRIDKMLARDPLGSGKEVHELLYQLIEPPLTVSYSVDQPRKIVEVAAISYSP